MSDGGNDHGSVLTRAANSLRAQTIQDTDLCWIFGAGRSGSTWLIELFDCLRGTCTWHEPYFGTLFHYLSKTPRELNRPDAFFWEDYKDAWEEGVRQLFFDVASLRVGNVAPGTKLIVKEVNAPDLCPFFGRIFPKSRYILLLRDPFDILDSQIDMQRPGSWNDGFGAESFGKEINLDRIQMTAKHIRESFELSLAGYDTVVPELRLRLRYEDMLARPVESLAECATFLELPVQQNELEQAVDRCSFEQYKSGKREFRRFGKAGSWLTSGNFTPEVTKIAMEVLGDLRQRLEYGRAGCGPQGIPDKHFQRHRRSYRPRWLKLKLLRRSR